MAAMLSEEQGRALLRGLAHDDALRAVFERDPAAALAELGVGSDVIDGLASKCLEKIVLAPKEDFAALLDSMDEIALRATMEMTVPRVRI